MVQKREVSAVEGKGDGVMMSHKGSAREGDGVMVSHRGFREGEGVDRVIDDRRGGGGWSDDKTPRVQGGRRSVWSDHVTGRVQKWRERGME